MLDDFNSKNWVWVPDESEVYCKGYVTDYLNDDTCKVTVVNGSQEVQRVVPQKDIENCNPSKFNKCEDMALLTHLNEPLVVYNLYLRYNDDLIYTYSGLFLVAINPYKSLSIYDTKTLNQYHDQEHDKPPPHIFGTTEKTFRNLVTNHKDQLILVTGELGAGKTENTKKIIQYLSLITPFRRKGQGHNKRNLAYSQTIDTKILQANPILELFGNAKTIKNNNSLRFGKFIKIYFNRRGLIVAATIDYYLLEKLRVVQQLTNERNYHIFYQLLRGHDDLGLLGLARDILAHKYLEGLAHTIPNVDDAKEFTMLCAAFKIMGIDLDQLTQVFRVLAVVLNLGNLEFTLWKSDQANFTLDLPIDTIVKFLGIKRDDFVSNMLRPKVKAGREFVQKLKKPAEVKFAIDALAKHLYEKLFQWIIAKINANLEVDGQTKDGTNFIGVLDIAGFEIFDVNSFEQLCINYTNEKLQQFFNHHSFILEQSEYLREDIAWEFIDFGQDLQPTIDLIETKQPMGVLKLLDEECIIPKLLDALFMDKLASNWGAGQLDKFKLNKYKLGFIIHHYAGMVEYNVDNWLQKNTDPVNEHVLKLLPELDNEFIRKLVENDEHLTSATPALPQKRGARVKTASLKHKEQLAQLMDQLELTEPLFVRCILPNLDKKPNKFDKRLVLNQLRCNGVLEGIRITRAGYPNRMTFEEFFLRYSIINPKEVYTKDARTNSELILKYTGLSDEVFKVGITKIFFKNGILGKLEEMRDLTLKRLFTDLQLVVRGKAARRHMQAKIKEIQLAQVIARSMQRVDESLKNLMWMELFVAVKPLLEELVKVLDLKEMNENLKNVSLKLKDAEKVLKDLEVENVKLRDQMKLLEDEIVTTTNQLKEKDSNLSKSLQLERQVRQELAATEAKLEALRESQRELKSTIADLEDKIEELEKELSLTKEENRQLLENHTNHSSKLTDMEAELKKTMAAYEEKMLKLKEQHEENVKSLHQDKEMLTRQTADLKREIELLRKLQPKHDALSREVSTANDQVRKFKADATAKEREMALLRSLMVRHETTTSNLQSKLTQTEMELSKLKNELDKKEGEIAKQREATQQAERSLKQAKANLSSIDSLTKELQETKLAHEKAAHEIRDLRHRVEAAVKDREEAEAKLQKAKVQTEHVRKVHDQNVNQIASLQHKVAKLERELKDAEQEKENQPPAILEEFGALKLKYNELNANWRKEKFEKKKLHEEVSLLRSRKVSGEFDGLTPRRQSHEATTLSLKRENESLRTRLLQQEAEAKRAEDYAIELQRKLNKLQQLRGLGLSQSEDYEKKYDASQKRLADLESKFERMISKNGDLALVSPNLLMVSKRLSLYLAQASPDFVAVYQDLHKTLKTTREELNLSKLEILRLKLLLRELEDELYQTKHSQFRHLTADYEQRTAELKVLNDKLTSRNTDLARQVDLFELRLKQYFNQLEEAELAVKTSQRKELEATKELEELKRDFKMAKEELRLHLVLVKELRLKVSGLEEQVQDRDHQIEQCNSQTDELKQKLNYYTNSYDNKEVQEQYRDEIRELQKELAFKQETETSLIKELKEWQLRFEDVSRHKRDLEQAAIQWEKREADLDNQISELTNTKRELDGEKVLNERKIGNLSRQITSLKRVVDEISQRRDELLDETELLHKQLHQSESQNEDLQGQLKLVQQDNEVLKRYLADKQSEHEEIRHELNQLKLGAPDDVVEYQRVKRELLVTQEENELLKLRTSKLTDQVLQLEHKLYSNDQIRFWEEKVNKLTDDLDKQQQENYEVSKLSKTLQRKVAELEIKLDNETRAAKKYNDENFSFHNQLTQAKLTIDILHRDNAEKDLQLKRYEREQLELKEKLLRLEQEQLRLQQSY